MQIVEDRISEWLPALHARRLPSASLFLRAQSHRKHALHHQRVAQQKWKVINKREGVVEDGGRERDEVTEKTYLQTISLSQ